MYKEDLKLGNTYYFNNREVVLLRMENETMAFCIAKCDITHDLTGSNFCTPCNIGGMSSHTCHDANETIEYIMDEINDEQVLWIPIVYLKEKPIEFKPNQNLLSEIKENESNLKSIKEHYVTQKAKTSEAIDYLKEIEDRINGLELKEKQLSESISELMEKKAEREIELNTVVKIKGSELTITAKELIYLYKKEIELNLLEGGGVDNWEWYSESLGDIDIEAEAIQKLIS